MSRSHRHRGPRPVAVTGVSTAGDAGPAQPVAPSGLRSGAGLL